MSYQSQKLELELRIQIMKDLKAGYPFNHLPDALEEFLAFADTMDKKDALLFLQGLTNALGSQETVKQWGIYPEYITNACQDLQLFSTTNYQNHTSENAVRANALAGIIVNTFCGLIVTALIAAVGLSFVFLPPMLPMLLSFLVMAAIIVAAVATCVLTMHISFTATSFLGFNKNESLWDALFKGNRQVDRVNTNLSKACSFFAQHDRQMVQYPPSQEFPVLETVYQPFANSMYG